MCNKILVFKADRGSSASIFTHLFYALPSDHKQIRTRREKGKQMTLEYIKGKGEKARPQTWHGWKAPGHC